MTTFELNSKFDGTVSSIVSIWWRNGWLCRTHLKFTYQYLCHSLVSPCFISHPFLVSNSGELLTRSKPHPSGVPRLSDGDGDKDSVEDMLSFFCKFWLRLCNAANPKKDWEEPLEGGVVLILLPVEAPEAEGLRRWAEAETEAFAVATSSLLKNDDLCECDDRYSLFNQVWSDVLTFKEKICFLLTIFLFSLNKVWFILLQLIL